MGGRLALCNHTIVTVLACPHRLIVIHRNRGLPCTRGVTSFAVVRSLNMRCGFPDIRAAVMAGNAGADHLGMIHRDKGFPNRTFAVTGATRATRRNMIFWLTGSRFSVVTRATVADNFCVIDFYLRGKLHCGVAFLAHVAGANMFGCFPRRRKVCTVVA